MYSEVMNVIIGDITHRKVEFHTDFLIKNHLNLWIKSLKMKDCDILEIMKKCSMGFVLWVLHIKRELDLNASIQIYQYFHNLRNIIVKWHSVIELWWLAENENHCKISTFDETFSLE